MTNKKKIRIIGVLFFSLGIFIFLSLFFYIINGAPGENVEEKKHIMGFVGDQVSRFLFEGTIGYACFIFPFLIMIWGINIVLTNRIAALKKFTAYALLVSLYTSIGFALYEIIKNTSGF